ncbi:unnamed protein product, partial [Arabidopsis halleri]
LEGDLAWFFSEEICLELKHSKTGTVAMVSSGENLNASLVSPNRIDTRYFPQGKTKGKVTDDGRLEYDWVPTDEELGPQELEEVINKNASHSSAVLLETKEDIPKAVEDSSTLIYIWGLNPCTDADGLNTIFHASELVGLESSKIVRLAKA